MPEPPAKEDKPPAAPQSAARLTRAAGAMSLDEPTMKDYKDLQTAKDQAQEEARQLKLNYDKFADEQQAKHDKAMTALQKQLETAKITMMTHKPATATSATPSVPQEAMTSPPSGVQADVKDKAINSLALASAMTEVSRVQFDIGSHEFKTAEAFFNRYESKVKHMQLPNEDDTLASSLHMCLGPHLTLFYDTLTAVQRADYAVVKKLIIARVDPIKRLGQMGVQALPEQQHDEVLAIYATRVESAVMDIMKDKGYSQLHVEDALLTKFVGGLYNKDEKKYLTKRMARPEQHTLTFTETVQLLKVRQMQDEVEGKVKAKHANVYSATTIDAFRGRGRGRGVPYGTQRSYNWQGRLPQQQQQQLPQQQQQRGYGYNGQYYNGRGAAQPQRGFANNRSGGGYRPAPNGMFRGGQRGYMGARGYRGQRAHVRPGRPSGQQQYATGSNSTPLGNRAGNQVLDHINAAISNKNANWQPQQTPNARVAALQVGSGTCAPNTTVAEPTACFTAETQYMSTSKQMHAMLSVPPAHLVLSREVTEVDNNDADQLQLLIQEHGVKDKSVKLRTKVNAMVFQLQSEMRTHILLQICANKDSKDKSNTPTQNNALVHAATCTDEQECNQSCKAYRRSVHHWATCASETCCVCVPIRQCLEATPHVLKGGKQYKRESKTGDILRHQPGMQILRAHNGHRPTYHRARYLTRANIKRTMAERWTYNRHRGREQMVDEITTAMDAKLCIASLQRVNGTLREQVTQLDTQVTKQLIEARMAHVVQQQQQKKLQQALQHAHLINQVHLQQVSMLAAPTTFRQSMLAAGVACADANRQRRANTATTQVNTEIELARQTVQQQPQLPQMSLQPRVPQQLQQPVSDMKSTLDLLADECAKVVNQRRLDTLATKSKVNTRSSVKAVIGALLIMCIMCVDSAAPAPNEYVDCSSTGRSGHPFDVSTELLCERLTTATKHHATGVVWSKRAKPVTKEAILCSLVIRETCTNTGFPLIGGHGVVSDTTTTTAIIERDCRRANATGIYEGTELVLISEHVRSTNKPIVPLYAFIGNMCSNTKDLYIETGEVATYDGVHYMSTLIEPGDCRWTNGHCELPRGMLIFDAKQEDDFCQYTASETMDVVLMNNHIVIEHLQQSYYVIDDNERQHPTCIGDKAIQLNENTFIQLQTNSTEIEHWRALLKGHWPAGQWVSDVATWQYMVDTLLTLMFAGDREVAYQLCLLKRQQRLLALQTIVSNPTYGMRAMLARDDINAIMAGDAVVVNQCRRRIADHVHSDHMVDGICYVYKPVTIDGQLMFVLPLSRDLVSASPEVNCDHRIMPYYVREGEWQTAHGTAQVTVMPWHRTLAHGWTPFIMSHPPVPHSAISGLTALINNQASTAMHMRELQLDVNMRRHHSGHSEYDRAQMQEAMSQVLQGGTALAGDTIEQGIEGMANLADKAIEFSEGKLLKPLHTLGYVVVGILTLVMLITCGVLAYKCKLYRRCRPQRDTAPAAEPRMPHATAARQPLERQKPRMAFGSLRAAWRRRWLQGPSNPPVNHTIEVIDAAETAHEPLANQELAITPHMCTDRPLLTGRDDEASADLYMIYKAGGLRGRNGDYIRCDIHLADEYEVSAVFDSGAGANFIDADHYEMSLNVRHTTYNPSPSLWRGVGEGNTVTSHGYVTMKMRWQQRTHVVSFVIVPNGTLPAPVWLGNRIQHTFGPLVIMGTQVSLLVPVLEDDVGDQDTQCNTGHRHRHEHEGDGDRRDRRRQRSRPSVDQPPSPRGEMGELFMMEQVDMGIMDDKQYSHDIIDAAIGECNPISQMATERMFVETMIAGAVCVSALCDTGASITVITRDVLRRLIATRQVDNLHDLKMMKSQYSDVSSISGHNLPIQGVVYLEVAIGTHMRKTAIHVLDDAAMPHEMILGYNYWQALGRVDMDFEAKVIRVRDWTDAAPLHTLTTSTSTTEDSVDLSIIDNLLDAESSMTMRTPRDYMLEAHSISLLPLVCIDAAMTICDTDLILIVPNDALLKGQYNVQGDCTLFRANQARQLALHITNDTDETIYLQAGTPVATATRNCVRDSDHNYHSGDLELASITPWTDADLINMLKFDKMALTDDEKREAGLFLHSHFDVHAKSTVDCGRLRLLPPVEANTGDHPPICVKNRPYQQRHKAEIERQIYAKLEAGLITPSMSPWGFSLNPVDKHDQAGNVVGTRLTMDLTKLNAITVPVRYPMHVRTDVLSALSTAPHAALMLCNLDLNAAFWAIPIREEDQQKFAFTCHLGKFQECRLPFGWASSPGLFTHAIDTTFAGLGDIMSPYMDDLLVWGADFPSMMANLEKVFDRIRTFGWKVNTKKSSYFVTKVDFLGIVLDRGAICVNADKIRALRELPPPTTAKLALSLFCMLSWWRTFVVHFSHRTHHMKVAKDSKPFCWTPAAESERVDVIATLSAEPSVSMPQYDGRPFHIYTDASTYGYAGVVEQLLDADNKYHPVAIVSRAVTDAESRYPAIHSEAGALHWTINTALPLMLHGQKMIAYTDHQALTQLLKPNEFSGRLLRFADYLQSHDLQIKYRPGKENHADVFSRLPVGLPQPDYVGRAPTIDALYGEEVPSVEQPWVTPTDLQNAQRDDDECNSIVAFVTKGTLPADLLTDQEREDFIGKCEMYVVIKDTLCRRTRITRHSLPKVVIPRLLVSSVIAAVHDGKQGGHLGRDKTFNKLAKRVFFARMSATVSEHVRACTTCGARKAPTAYTRLPMTPHAVHPLPYYKVAMDTKHLTVDLHGFKYVLVVKDYFTHSVDLQPLKATTALATAEALLRIISIRGCFRYIVSDGAPDFVADVVAQLCKMMGTAHIVSVAYYAQSHGSVENFMRVLGNMLNAYSDNDEWSALLPMTALAYNTSICPGMTETPFYLSTGYDACLPIDTMLINPDCRYVDQPTYAHETALRMALAWRITKEKVDEAHALMKDKHDAKANKTPEDFYIGQRVRLHDKRVKKGDNLSGRPFTGPYRITQLDQFGNAKLQLIAHPRAKLKKVHLTQLKLDYSQSVTTRPFVRPPTTLTDLTDGTRLEEQPVDGEATEMAPIECVDCEVDLLDTDMQSVSVCPSCSLLVCRSTQA